MWCLIKHGDNFISFLLDLFGYSYVPLKRNSPAELLSKLAQREHSRLLFGEVIHVARLYECRVCSDYAQPPILQRHTGRLICSNCRPEATCPKCRAPLGDIRNLEMQAFASSVMFPCKYSTFGCAVAILHTERREHEDAFEYRPYSCPCRGASCKWQVMFGHHFVFVLKKQENFGGHQKFFAIVQLIGSRKPAENFAYRFEMNSQGRRLAWESITRSIHEGVSSAIMNSDCVVFDSRIAQHFADKDNLSFLVSIRMV
ncbi:E3 ubiquitin-protein ligase SIAH1 [Cryptotermes secundus]|uniref:E3 ubiquitin-protein ligase n=1 Tax=Cryptotermes secundus TaxID=105785 RepID=A0A2J7QTB5_9NEOP|nr:E3 ubiquitin-protein ligase SIAH1 [Cryptotermes secundus]